MDTLTILLAVAGAPVAFVAMWTGICWLISHLSGWQRLAALYAHDGPFVAQWGMQSARIGWASYNGVLTVGADRGGLYLKPILPFRVGHAPLYIPWSDVTTAAFRFIFSYYVFQVKKVPRARIRVYERLGRRIAEAAGGLPGLDGG